MPIVIVMIVLAIGILGYIAYSLGAFGKLLPAAATPTPEPTPEAAATAEPTPTPTAEPTATPEPTPPPIYDDGTEGHMSSGILIYNNKGFEMFYGSDSMATAYAETLKLARATGLPVIADIKRGDIAKTAEMYAMGHFTGDFESDFVTLAPYMGLDSISPYLPYAEKQGKGMFVLCRTSNGGAKDFEYEKLADGRHVYDLVGDKLNALGKDYMGEHGYSSIGLVIGGTHIEEATEIRAKYQDSFFLIPGYGAQGGKAEDIAQYLTKGNGGVVNSSRGILLAYKKQPGTAFDEAAYNECVNMKEAIAHACSLL